MVTCCNGVILFFAYPHLISIVYEIKFFTIQVCFIIERNYNYAANAGLRFGTGKHE